MFSSTLQIAGSVIGFIFSLVGLFIIPILVFYFLKDFEMIFKNIIDIATKKTGVDLYYYNNEFNSILKKYFRGQFFVCVILAFLYGTVDLIIGIKGGFFIGFVAGLLSFIPYLGFISGIVSSLIISYVQFGDIWHPFFVLIGFGAVQMLESYLLTPKLIGESLGLHPTAVIFAVLAGGYLLGIGGIILSIPLAAFIKIIGSKLLEQI
jgi:predicted PurR-regulated permease PerM